MDENNCKNYPCFKLKAYMDRNGFAFPYKTPCESCSNKFNEEPGMNAENESIK